MDTSLAARPLPHGPLSTLATLASRTGHPSAGLGIGRRGSVETVEP
ncbi:hypothetical protein [Actinoplanes sp. ATCC 53533]|nr:hypothetical protein [Actinoplanes sp. ATCC 53533]